MNALPTTVGNYLNYPNSQKLDPLEFAYFTDLSRETWFRAKFLSKRSIEALQGTPYLSYMQSHGPVEKAGEFILKAFLDENCSLAYDVNFTQGDQFLPSFSIGGITVDCHTRMIKEGLLDTTKLLPMVPELGLLRRAAIYAFCGFNVTNSTGYALGWLTSDEVARIPVSSNLSHKAKCSNLYALHPMHTLLEFLTQ